MSWSDYHKGTWGALFSYMKSYGQYGEIFSKMIPEPSIDRITIHGGLSNTAPLKVNFFLTLKDFVDPTDELISGWFRSLGNDDPETSAIEEFIRIKIVQCTHPLVYKHLSGKATLKDLKDADINQDDYIFTRQVNLKEKIPLDLDPQTEAVGIDEFKHFDEQGREVLYLPVEETFKVFPQPADINGVEHLSYFVWVDLDMAGLARSLDVQERFFEHLSTKRYVAAERVIDNYNLVLDTTVYLLEDGTEWKGPVHSHSPQNNPLPSDPSFDGWMTGIRHDENSVKLTTVIQPNPKIRDMRTSTRVDERYRSVTQQRIGAGLADGAALVGQAVEEETITATVNDQVKHLGQNEVRPEKPSAVWTSLYTSTDEMHNVSGLVGFDWISFLKQNCAFPWLWEVSGPTTTRLLQLASVSGLYLYRRQVEPRSRDLNRVGTPHLPRPNKKFSKSYRWLGSTSEKRAYWMRWLRERGFGALEDVETSNKVRKIDNSRLYLKECKIHSSDQPEGIRWFTFTDRSVIKEKNGTYQYTMALESKDPTVVLLLSQYRRLIKARASLAEYSYYAYGYTKLKPNYDIYLDRFIPEFIETFSTNADNRVTYWQEPCNDYLNVLNTISNTLQQPAYPGASYTLETTLPATLSSYVDPRKGSPEGITIALSMFDSLIGTIRKHLRSALPSDRRGSTKNGVRPSHVRTRGSQRTIRTTQVFDNEITLDGMRGKGYDYLTNQTKEFASENIKGAGLRMMSARYFRSRSKTETKRFFSSAQAKWSYKRLLKAAVPDIDLSNDTGSDSVKSSQFTFFTPSFVFSSPGIALGGASFSSPMFGPPNNKKAAGGTSVKKSMAGGVSYLASNKNMTNIASKVMQPVSLIPLGLQTRLDTALPSATKTLDDVAADLLIAQGDPDFNLYPKNIKAYEVPNQKGSKISQEEQQQKAKYAAVLAGKGCVVVSEKEEFGDVALATNRHPEGYDVQNVKYKPMTLDIFPRGVFTNLKRMLYVNRINPLMFRKNTYSIKTNFFPSGLMNVKSLPILKFAGSSINGVKPATKGLNTPIGFGSVHLGNLKLLNFGGGSDKTILDTTNPSDKIAKLKALPNQLKSLALADSGLTIKNAFEVAPTTPSNIQDPAKAAATVFNTLQIPPLFQAANLNAAFQLYKNIVQIEYLDSFTNPVMPVRNPQTGKTEKVTGSRPLLRNPQWSLLSESVITDLEDTVTEKTTILCRVVRYVNRELGIGHSTKLDLPVIDKHFILTIDPDVEYPIQFSFNWGSWMVPSLYTGGSTTATDGDYDSRVLDSAALGTWKITSPHDGSEITVKDFDGVIRKCDPESGDGGLP